MNGMCKQYLETQVEHPNAIIVKRIGDFYEVIGLGAILVSDEMDFTLTGRDCGLKERVLMVGFPFCMLNEVVTKLQSKYEVFIIE